MKISAALLLVGPLLTFTAPPEFPPGKIEPPVNRVERFLQLWSACDSVAEEYAASLVTDKEIVSRCQRYVLALYWRAELEAYAALTDSERTYVWPVVTPGVVAPRRVGELFHQEIREHFLPTTPTVSRRIVRTLHESLRVDLLGRGLDADFARNAAHLWPPFLYHKRPHLKTVAFF